VILTDLPDVFDLVAGLDDANVDVGPGSHVVQDAGGDSVADQLLRLFLGHFWLPTELLKWDSKLKILIWLVLNNKYL